MGSRTLVWILLCVVYMAISGIIPLLQLINKGDAEFGFEIGWLGLTDLKLQNPVEFFTVSIVILFVQFLLASKLWAETNVRQSTIRSIFFISMAFIYLVTFLSQVSDFVFNLCNLYTNIGIGYFLLTKGKWNKIIFYGLYFVTQILQFALTSGRGYLIIPLMILLWFFSNKIKTRIMVGSGVLIFGLLFYLTRVKFENLDETLIMNFILGRFNQLDSFYIFYHHSDWLPISNGFCGQRYFESIDYFGFFDSVNLDLILYNQVFAAGLGGFAVHPYAELYWYLKSTIFSMITYIFIIFFIYKLVIYLSSRFDFVKLYIPLIVMLVFIKPESMIVVGQVCIKNLFFLVLVQLILLEFEKYFCKKST